MHQLTLLGPHLVPHSHEHCWAGCCGHSACYPVSGGGGAAAQPLSLPYHPYQSSSPGVSGQRVVSVSGPAVPGDSGPSSVSMGKQNVEL